MNSHFYGFEKAAQRKNPLCCFFLKISSKIMLSYRPQTANKMHHPRPQNPNFPPGGGDRYENHGIGQSDRTSSPNRRRLRCTGQAGSRCPCRIGNPAAESAELPHLSKAGPSGRSHGDRKTAKPGTGLKSRSRLFSLIRFLQAFPFQGKFLMETDVFQCTYTQMPPDQLQRVSHIGFSIGQIMAVGTQQMDGTFFQHAHRHPGG